MKPLKLDRHLVLYSGGADSTYLLEEQPSARHLVHFRGLNLEKTKVAVANAARLNRRLSVVDAVGRPSLDGEVNEFHAFDDTIMVMEACRTALSFGMKGIVLGFNRDDIGIDIRSVSAIVKRVQPDFEILTPLARTSAAKIRTRLKKTDLKYVSCMVSERCGWCPKCSRGY